LKSYDEAIKIDKNDIDSWYNKGSILKEQGHYPQALKCYDEAIKIDKGFFLPWLNKGNTLRKILNNLGESASSKLKLYDEAEICYNNTIKLNSHFAYSHYYLAILKIKRYLIENNDKHKKEGFQALMNAIKLQPQLKNAAKSSEIFIKLR
jgi:tetratricopeptide (TPR) repeat protein